MNSSEKIQITETGGALGAEICGLDLSQPLADDAVAAVRQALLDHCVVFFRGQQFGEEAQVRFTNYFGRAVEHTRKQEGQKLPEVFIISNVMEDGRLIGALGSGELSFHSDLSYMPKPGTLSLLYAVEVPDEGGQTQWCNCYAAYDALDEETKTRLTGLRAVHRHHNAEQNPPEHVDHPIVRVHPETGRKSLFISRHFTKYVVGMQGAESWALLDRLFNHIEEPRFVWTHEWQPGDLVMWDNRPTMHRREPFPNTQRRIMKRTQVYGDDVPIGAS